MAVFGFVSANYSELTDQQKDRYSGVYCGICRAIGSQSAQIARTGLSYDMAFLAVLLMSLYEPEEQQGRLHCALHPLRKQDWIQNEFVAYAADLNVVLAYYKSLDDKEDDGRLSAAMLARAFAPSVPRIEGQYPRQCQTIRSCIGQLRDLERANCRNPDEPAGVFGHLMGELLVYREDIWAPTLRQMGMALGRFVYLADAVTDFDADVRKKKYNPFLAMEETRARWEDYLVLAMGRCTAYYERLPLVQDKALLDNILYSGVWTGLGRKGKKTREADDRSV